MTETLSRPETLFRRVAIAEAVTWALLLFGMFLKYVTDTTDLGVRVFGMVHGVVFVAYVVTTLAVGVDRRWSARRLLLALLAAVPPGMTVPLERYAVGHGWLGQTWRLRATDPAEDEGVRERVVGWLLREPVRGIAFGLLAVFVLTGVALLVGPPASS